MGDDTRLLLTIIVVWGLATWVLLWYFNGRRAAAERRILTEVRSARDANTRDTNRAIAAATAARIARERATLYGPAAERRDSEEG